MIIPQRYQLPASLNYSRPTISLCICNCTWYCAYILNSETYGVQLNLLNPWDIKENKIYCDDYLDNLKHAALKKEEQFLRNCEMGQKRVVVIYDKTHR